MSLDIELTFDESQLQKLMEIPLLLRMKSAERVLKAMGKVVVARGKALAPSSRKSGTRDKWSQKYKKNAAYQNDSGRSIGYVFRPTEQGGYLVIGGIYPLANKQNFEAGTKRKVLYWGRDSGKVKRIDPKERFMTKAFDETRQEQITAGNKQLEREAQELNFG